MVDRSEVGPLGKALTVQTIWILAGAPLRPFRAVGAARAAPAGCFSAFLTGLVEQPCFNDGSCDRTRDVSTTSGTKKPIVRQGLFDATFRSLHKPNACKGRHSRGIHDRLKEMVLQTPPSKKATEFAAGPAAKSADKKPASAGCEAGRSSGLAAYRKSRLCNSLLRPFRGSRCSDGACCALFNGTLAEPRSGGRFPHVGVGA